MCFKKYLSRDNVVNSLTELECALDRVNADIGRQTKITDFYYTKLRNIYFKKYS